MPLTAATLLATLLARMVPTVLGGDVGPRQPVSLDGEWQFALLSGSAGAGDSQVLVQSGTIQVPGAWEAQGYGNETATMRSQVVTGQNTGAVGVYTKQLTLSPCQAPGAKHVFTVDQGIHRHAVFKIGGKVVGEHTGYMTPFEHVLDAATTKDCCCGSTCEVEISLDGNRACDAGGCADALMGCMDDDIDPQGPGPWAGLNGHVAIECRPATYIDGGVGNIMPPHVTHPPVTTDNAGKPLTISVAILISGGAAPASVQILDNSTGTPVPVASSAASTKPVAGNVTLHVTIPQVKLWSPENRSLYTAVVTLGSGSTPLDQATTRFGVRTVTVSDGYKLMLNGHRLFLAGYGDDAIYPRTIAAPREKDVYAEKVKFTHEHGFNFVRHHSHTLPPEYFDACDEWGIFVSPELPCAYGNFFKAGNATAQALYLASWTSYIGSYRNHPSVLTWTLCNEMKMPDTFKLPGSDQTFGSQVFLQVKQALDPSRLMNDQDGACTAADARPSLSFCSHQFNVGQLGCIGYNQSGSCLGGDMPTKYHDTCSTASGSHACSFKTAPTLPMISHETGNYNSFPRIQSLIDFFNASGAPVLPYWLTPAQSKLNASGLLSEVDAWATASEQLYVLCWKIDIEDQRRNSMMSGYEWWLVTDYWTGNNGITDVFFRPKPGVADYITQFNARSIFLQDGLELVYVSNDTLTVDLSLSHFGEGPLPTGTKITWEVLMDGVSIKTATVATKQTLPQGELSVVASINCQLPDVGTSASVPLGGLAGPKQITLTVEFAAGSAARPAPKNSWNATLFPAWVAAASPTKHPIQVTDPSLQKSCGFSDCEVSSGDVAGGDARVYLATAITDALLKRVEAGSVVVLVQGASSSRFFKSERTNFKQAWWVGDAVDNNAGTLVYDNAASVLGGMAPDGYGGQSWFRMIDGAQTFLLDEQWPNMPGGWTSSQKGTYGSSDGCYDDVAEHDCPASFPFPVNPETGGTCGLSCKGVVCYKDAAEAKAGEGPCGSWCTKSIGIGTGCGDGVLCPMHSCPKAFPFPTAEGGIAHGEFCYDNATDAKQGTGPCGSWCTFVPNSPRATGCGDPKTHVCPPPPPPPSEGNHTKTSCKPAANITECQGRCDEGGGCNAVNFNVSHGCCLESCGVNASSTPPTGGGCCGFARETGPPMPRDGVTVMMRAIDIVTLSRNKALMFNMPLGKGQIVATGLKLLNQYSEQEWVLDRLLRLAGSLLK